MFIRDIAIENIVVFGNQLIVAIVRLDPLIELVLKQCHLLAVAVRRRAIFATDTRTIEILFQLCREPGRVFT
ncbi:Uncharacterised protein [Escherichia coli]|nr:Uncharacterised protein [Escherichia coli]